MMESIDRLRVFCDKLRNVDDNHVSAEYVAERCATDVRMMADEIEREIAERYMLCPVDADGVPIRVGDVLERVDGGPSQKASCVCSSGFNDEPIWNASYFRHAPRTVEDVLADFAADVENDRNTIETARKYAAEIRELMEGGEE